MNYSFMLVIKRSWCKNPEAQTPLSVDTNTCPSRRTTNVPFVLMLPQKSAFVAWHHRDTSNTDKKSGSKPVGLIWVTRFRICREF